MSGRVLRPKVMNWAVWIVAGGVLASACGSTSALVDRANQPDAATQSDAENQEDDGQAPVGESGRGDATPGTLASLSPAERDELCASAARKRDGKTCGSDAMSSGAVPTPDALYGALCNDPHLSPFFFTCSATVTEFNACFDALANNCWMNTTSADCSRIWHCLGPVPSDPYAPSDAGSDATDQP